MTSPTAPTPALASDTGAPTAARIVANETAKGLRIVWAHRVTLVSSVFTTLVMYLTIQYFLGDGAILDELVALTAPGLFAYIVAFLATLRVVAGLLEERNTGTLEQSHLAPVPAWQLVIGRLAAAMIEAVAVATVVVGGVLLARGVDYALSWPVLLTSTLTLASIVGLALVLAAISFVLPGIGALLHIVHGLLLVLNGTIIPPELFPRWLELIAKLLPSTLGISATRRVLVDGASLAELAADGSLGWLTLHTVALVAGGWIAYQRQVRRALRDGRMGPG
jgi:ABC-2 type transport system permease protein